MKNFHIWVWDTTKWVDWGCFGNDLRWVNMWAGILQLQDNAAYIPVTSDGNPNRWEITREVRWSPENALSFAKAHCDWIDAGCKPNVEVVWDQTNGGYKLDWLTEDYLR